MVIADSPAWCMAAVLWPVMRQQCENAGLVIGIEFPEDSASALHYGGIKTALGGKGAGVIFCEHQMVASSHICLSFT